MPIPSTLFPSSSINKPKLQNSYWTCQGFGGGQLKPSEANRSQFQLFFHTIPDWVHFYPIIDELYPKGCMIYIQSSIGGRTKNQDYFGSAQTKFGELIIVCDGMGGHNGGRHAAKRTVQMGFGA